MGKPRAEAHRHAEPLGRRERLEALVQIDPAVGVAVGLAFFGIALGFEEPVATFPMIAFAAFPGFIGLAFIVLGLLNKTKA